MKLRKATLTGLIAVILAGTAIMGCRPDGPSGAERLEENSRLYPWASQECLEQEGGRLWSTRSANREIRTANLKHNALMLRLCELEHRMEAVQGSLDLGR